MLSLTITVNLDDDTEIDDIGVDVLRPDDIWPAIQGQLSERDIDPIHVTSYVLVIVPDQPE